MMMQHRLEPEFICIFHCSDNSLYKRQCSFNYLFHLSVALAKFCLFRNLEIRLKPCSIFLVETNLHILVSFKPLWSFISPMKNCDTT